MQLDMSSSNGQTTTTKRYQDIPVQNDLKRAGRQSKVTQRSSMEVSSLKNGGLDSYGMRAQTSVPKNKRKLGSNSTKRMDILSPNFRFMAKSKAENHKPNRKIDRKLYSDMYRL